MSINNRKVVFVSCLLVTVTLLVACSTRSISNSGYEERNIFGSQSELENPFYTGELSELDVIGINPKAEITESDIQKAIVKSNIPLTINKGSAVMLIQSGAMIPDSSMVSSMNKYYNVSVFSGVPQRKENGKTSYSKLLRLAAAKGGYNKIICYWGLLETAQKDLSSKTISWVPFLGGVIPDEDQQMRIRLKVAVVDVKSGRWEMFSPKTFADETRSSRNTRRGSDQQQVMSLKAKAYATAVEALVTRYAR